MPKEKRLVDGGRGRKEFEVIGSEFPRHRTSCTGYLRVSEDITVRSSVFRSRLPVVVGKDDSCPIRRSTVRSSDDIVDYSGACIDDPEGSSGSGIQIPVHHGIVGYDHVIQSGTGYQCPAECGDIRIVYEIVQNRIVRRPSLVRLLVRKSDTRVLAGIGISERYVRFRGSIDQISLDDTVCGIGKVDICCPVVVDRIILHGAMIRLKAGQSFSPVVINGIFAENGI